MTQKIKQIHDELINNPLLYYIMKEAATCTPEQIRILTSLSRVIKDQSACKAHDTHETA